MDTETAYNAALDYLYSFVDYSLKHASELAKADFNLERMFALMEALGNPQQAYAIIHVAGTKGKGSACALMASALQAAGYRTGLFTSPHLQDYAERIQINGQPIPHGQLVEMVEMVRGAVARIPKLTTFEITTALGFLYFAQQKVDAAVIEVGLGGRLDATNVITPRVAVITSLSYDHMVVLGNTLAQIAAEKAGIIKPGVPLVSAPQNEEALQVIEKVAAERNAPLTLVGRDVTFKPLTYSLDGQTFELSSFRLPPSSLRLRSGQAFTIPLLGAHQVENAAVAAAALWTARRQGIAIDDAHIRQGFAAANWPGRFEVVRREPPVVLDSAHNRDAALKLRQTLDLYFPGWPIMWVFATLEDKDVLGMIEELKPRLEQIIVTRLDHPRALEPEQIVALARQAGVGAEAATPAAAALARALELAGERALVLSAGSVAFTGEVRAAWQKLERRVLRNEK